MGHFTTDGKSYTEGGDMPGFADLDAEVNSNPSGQKITQTAPSLLDDADGNERGFLFWDTGRRITGKRKVRWTFKYGDNWSEWNAVAWYGLPGGGPGQPLITTSAYRVAAGPISPTPIAPPPTSTFVNAPGGTPVAWPWSGNDHVVRTEWGAATVHAKASMASGPMVGDPTVYFSSWIELVYGGDDASTYFEENDNGIDPGGAVTGIQNSTLPYFTVPQGGASIRLAGYVDPPPVDIPPLLELIRGLLLEKPGKYIYKGDPSPDDLIRLKLIAQTLDIVRGEPAKPADAFEGLLGAAKKMNAAELKRTIAGTRATLLRGQAALKSLEALAKQLQKGGG